MSSSRALVAQSAEMTRASSRGNADIGIKILYAVTFVIGISLVVIPLSSLVYGSFVTETAGRTYEWTLKNWAGLLSRGVVGTLFNTLVIALLTAASSVVAGFCFAWIVARSDLRFKGLLTVMMGLSFFFPGFILAMAWIILGSPGGFYNHLVVRTLGLESLAIDIYSLGGIVWIQFLHLTPFAFFALKGPIASMDSSYEEAAAICGANNMQILRRITLPLLVFPVLSSFLLTFILAIEQFAIPAMVGIPGQVNVLATQLYLLASFSPPDHGLAAAVGLGLSGLTGLAILVQRWIVRRYAAASIGGKSYRPKQVSLGRAAWIVYPACVAFALFSFMLPVLAVIYTSLVKYFVADPFAASYTLRNYTYIFTNPGSLRSFVNTIIVAGGGAVLGLALGTVIAYSTHRLKPPGYRILDVVTSLPFGIPGIVIGLGFLWSYVYLPVYGTLWVLVFCYIARFMPYATETVGAQIVQIDKSLEEAAWSSGASKTKTFFKIVLPLLKPALQGAYFLLFISYFREVAAAVLLYTSKTAVVSISIWSFFEAANWGTASALSVVSSAILMVIMAIVSRDIFKTGGKSGRVN